MTVMGECVVGVVDVARRWSVSALGECVVGVEGVRAGAVLSGACERADHCVSVGGQWVNTVVWLVTTDHHCPTTGVCRRRLTVPASRHAISRLEATQ